LVPPSTTSPHCPAPQRLTLALFCLLVSALMAAPASAATPIEQPTPTLADQGVADAAAVQDAAAGLDRLGIVVLRAVHDYDTARMALDEERTVLSRSEQAQDRAVAAQRDAQATVDAFAASAFRNAGGVGLAPLTAALHAGDLGDFIAGVGMLNTVARDQADAVRRLDAARAVTRAATEDARGALDRRQSLITQIERDRVEAVNAVSRQQDLLAAARDRQQRDQQAATAEADRQQALRLAASQAAAALLVAQAQAALSGPAPATSRPGPPSPAPAVAGPVPTVPGPDVGDGEPGPDHLRPRAERAKLLITATFGLTDLGGWRETDAISSDHPTGRAVDAMLAAGVQPSAANVDLGWRVALWAQQNSAALGVTYVIWQNRIWSTSQATEGWRTYCDPTQCAYGDQQNPTTLHMDHVHISFR
jgi:hypothetical protein